HVAKACYKLNHLDQSIKHSQEIIRNHPNNTQALANLAACYAKQQNYSDSLNCWKRVLSVEPANIKAKYEITKLFRRMECFEDAAKIYYSIRDQLDRTNIYMIGRIAEVAGMLRNAEIHYRQATELTEVDESSFVNLINFYLKYGNLPQAYEYSKRGTEYFGDTESLRSLINEIRGAASSIGFNIDDSTVPNSENFCAWRNIIAEIIRRSKSVTKNVLNPVQGRVAFLVTSFGPGGAERQCVNLVKALSQLDPNPHESLTVLCKHLSWSDRDNFYLSDLDGLPIRVKEYYVRNTTIDPHAIPEIAHYSDLLKHIHQSNRQQELLQLIIEFLKLRPAIIHCWLDDRIIVAALAGIIVGVPRIITYWGSMPSRMYRKTTEYHSLQEQNKNAAYRALATLPQIVFTANSRAVRDAYAQWIGIPAQRISVVYSALNNQNLLLDAKKTDSILVELDIPETSPIIGTVIRFQDVKQPILWAQTALRILDDVHDAHFIMVGDGPLREMTEEFISQFAVRDRFHLVGNKMNIVDWYRIMDVVILTSRVEGLSNVILEAQSLGIPVVIPDVGGLSEGVIDGLTGWLVQSQRVEEYAEKIICILSDNDWRERARKKGKRFILDKFSEKKRLQKIVKLYGFPPLTKEP
ncbi:glycosyltransferase, partial [candidate division CSSED10-310 bacterium]